MLGKGKLMLFVSLLLAGVAAWLANTWVQQHGGSAGTPAAVELSKVAVAALPIAYGEKIEPRHVKLVDWPKDYVPSGTVTDVKMAEGFVATADFNVGDLIATAKIAEHPDGSRLAALVGEGMRAMSVRVDDVVGVAGFILPGNRIDVLGVRTHGSNSDSVVKVVVSDVKVLAVDQEVSANEKAAKIVRAVTLEVSTSQSEDLVKASNEGRIHITLRNPMDRKHADAKPVAAPKTIVKKVIVTKEVTKEAEPPPSDPYRVTIIRGTNVTEEKPKM